MSAVRQHKRFLLLLFGVFLGGAALMTLRPFQFGLFNHFWLGAFNHSWLAGLYSILILIAFADTEPRLTGLLRAPVLVWLGQLSFGIYIFHQAVSGLLHGLLRRDVPHIRNPLDAGITVLALGVTVLLAQLSFRFIESPILRIGHRFRYRPRPTENALLQVA